MSDDIRTVFTEGDYESTAQLLEAHISKEQLTESLRRYYDVRDETVPPVYHQLAAIPFSAVITTNWDSVLDIAFANRQPVIVSPRTSDAAEEKLPVEEVMRVDAFTIIKLHGDLTNPRNLVFTDDELRRASYDDPMFFRYISSLLYTRTVLFIGMSLKGIEDLLRTLGMRRTSPETHFALIPRTSGVEAHLERFRARFAIQLLPFDARPGFPEVTTFVQRLNSAVMPEHTTVTKPSRGRRAYLERIRLRNIGAFKSLDIPLSRRWNVLLGNNGRGKTTILRAIALGLCAEEYSNHELRWVLRTGTNHGSIELTIGGDTYRTDVVRDRDRVRIVSDQLTPLQTGRLLVLGFPTFRGIPGENPVGLAPGGPGFPTIADVLPILENRIDPRVPDLKQWIVNTYLRSEGSDPARKLNAALLRKFFAILRDLTPGVGLNFDHIDRSTWDVMVRTVDGVVPLDWLSQGTISVMGWLGIVLQRLHEIYGGGNPEHREALVLIDEVDAQMHPEWQRSLVGVVRRHLPKVQVLATTHSPLVVGSLEANEVIHLNRKENSLQAERLGICFAGLRADQILTSRAFGLSTTLSTEPAEMLREYSRLIGLPRRSPAEQSTLAELSLKLDHVIPSHPEREESREALTLLNEWLKQRLRNQSTDQKEAIIREANRYLGIVSQGFEE